MTTTDVTRAPGRAVVPTTRPVVIDGRIVARSDAPSPSRTRLVIALALFALVVFLAAMAIVTMSTGH